ncbi:hypothetical protein BDV24DRAFT_144113 [Aspergillus arachidicola]|uniref:Uncharacterized protein n=1 Tax=Aspergillus arachidicola TaxID=656916 RepID=A0A5N6XSF9_9EURO|nr:hypothetical protein BDV24DRAFT_144113 [Aspergillus arachidicola]
MRLRDRIIELYLPDIALKLFPFLSFLFLWVHEWKERKVGCVHAMDQVCTVLVTYSKQ